MSLPNNAAYEVDFAKHRRPRPNGAPSSSPSAPLASSAAFRDTKTTGKNHVVGYRGHVPSTRFSHGESHLLLTERARDTTARRAEERSSFTTTLTSPSDVEAPYRVRGGGPGASGGGASGGGASGGGGGGAGSVVVDGVEVVPYPAGYKGHVPGRGFAFGENFRSVAGKLAAEQERKRQERAVAGSQGCVHPREVGAHVPEPPVYLVPSARAGGATAHAATLSSSSRENTGRTVNLGPSSVTSEKKFVETMTTGEGGPDLAEWLRPTETGHMRKLKEKRERQERRKEAEFTRGVVTITDQDEEELAKPSYLRKKELEDARGAGGSHKVPGYGGHFGGKEFDLGISYGERTRGSMA